jgi:alkanesulfonate monooxygenase SsuD/methylene tetrahydromethanopterin reductase-like flavin-dependent oxidoreductase (luciferase family)
LRRIGFDDVVDGEHILFTPSMHNPGGAGNMVHGRSTQLSDRADTIVMFSVFAARTSRIRLVSTNMQVAAHSFGVLAKQAATLDVISGGRFVLGASGGWHAAQFAAQGIAPAERTARAEETIRACLQLWKPGQAAFHGRWIDFQDMVSEPALLTPGGPPVWWSGNALVGATTRRIVEFGSGWIAREAANYDEIASSIELIQKGCTEAGRSPDEVGFRASVVPTGDRCAWRTKTELFDVVLCNSEKLTGAGVTHFTIPLNYLNLDLNELTDLLRALHAI